MSCACSAVTPRTDPLPTRRKLPGSRWPDAKLPRILAATATPTIETAEALEVDPATEAALPDARRRQRGATTSRVLVLNASYEPINVCTVRRAAVLVLKERAEIVERSEWNLHSENLTLPRPVVIRLTRYVQVPRDAHSRKITRRAIFARDRWTCQYCGSDRNTLTVDHVIPRCRGGSSSWDNIVTCCAPCNRRKGNRLPKQANMRPRRRPKVPSPTVFVHVATPTIPAVWEQYLVAA